MANGCGSLNLDQYMGKWIAVLNGEIVASSDKADKVFEKVDRDYPNTHPIFHRVTDIDELWAI